MAGWRRLLNPGLALVLALGGLGLGGGWSVPVQAAPALAQPAPIAAVSSYSNVPPGCGAQTLLVSHNPGTVIPQFGTSIITDTLPTISFSSVVYTTHISVTVDISHTFSGDLNLFLISPRGTRVSLSINHGTSLDNIYRGATFDDRAGLTHPPGPVTLANYQNNVPLGLVNPEEPLSAFNGENPNGLWTLEVRDTQNGDGGRFNSWALSITGLSDVPTPQFASLFGFHSPQAIPDGSGALDIFASAPILDAPIYALTLTTQITHARPSDLAIDLITPDGLTLTVSSHNGGSKANVFAGTTWYDAAGAANPPGAVSENTYVSGTVETPLAPQEAFAEINGFDTMSNLGFWQLIVRDTVPGVAGTVGDVQLGAIGLSCLPEVEAGITSDPFFVRLGRPAHLQPYMFNRSAPASDVLLKTSMTGGLAFVTDTGHGVTCAPVPAGTLNPVVDCLRPSLSFTDAVSQPTVDITLTAPLQPVEALITSSATSSKPNLQPNRNSSQGLVFAFAGSVNGQPWDVFDAANLDYDQDNEDTGGMRDGGQRAFGVFGNLDVRVLNNTSGAVLDDQRVGGFKLTFSPGQRWHSLNPRVVAGVSVQRDLLAPTGANFLRYVDTFTNGGGSAVKLVVGWGGFLGSSDATKVAATSSGDLTLNQGDQWGVTFEQDTPNGPSPVPPVATIFRSKTDSSYQGPYLFSSDPITSTFWPSLGSGDLGQVFSFVLAPGQTRALAYFVARGLAEGRPGPQDCDYYGGCVTPAAGSQVTLMEQTAAGLAAAPFFCDLPASLLAELVNWPGLSEHCLYLPTLAR